MSDLLDSLFGSIATILGALIHAFVFIMRGAINIAVVLFLIYGIYRISRYLIREYRLKRAPKPEQGEAAPMDEHKNGQE